MQFISSTFLIKVFTLILYLEIQYPDTIKRLGRFGNFAGGEIFSQQKDNQEGDNFDHSFFFNAKKTLN